MFRRLGPFLILSLLVVIFYRQAIFSNLIFARGDTFLYFYPYWDYGAQALLAGRLPLWNPYLFMGAPFLANSQAGVLYPLNWPLVVFGAPVAVKISMVAHVIIAAWGAYTLARRAFSLEPVAAVFSATLFAMGGYVSAQVEHVNQLQGLAWLPLAILATHRLTSAARSRRALRHLVGLAVVLALQLTAGHTQTAFMTLVACLLAAARASVLSAQHQPPVDGNRPRLWAKAGHGLGLWTLGVILAMGLAAAQLLPTLELSRLSLRGGGLTLNEAVSFSLNPLLLGRALLPGYSRVIFSEFVAYLGVTALGLAALGAARVAADTEPANTWPQRFWMLVRQPLFPALLLAGIGLFFALGAFNPAYVLLAHLPGFNFFRVPARWLALFALGAAVLAGYGLQWLWRAQLPALPRPTFAALLRSPHYAMLLVPCFAMVLAYLSAGVTPPGELGPLGAPAWLDLALWLAPVGSVALIVSLGSGRLRGLGVVAVGALELFLAAAPLPLNHLTAPEAYSSVRPAMTQLLAAQPVGARAGEPPARFLSLSALQFDPGDLGELNSAFGPQLAPDALYDLIIATKNKEVLAPNLPLSWRVPSVDGYDGGILPLRAYAEFAGQFGDLPLNSDGRLRHFLAAIPPNHLLSLTNTRWIITDKTGDAWLDDVFFDLGLTAVATAATPVTIDRIPGFEATALGLVLGEPSQSGVAQIAFTNGTSLSLPITFDPARPALRLQWETPARIKQIDILTPNRLTLCGASLIDERTDTFHGLTLGPYRLAHSGDVKVYENLNVLPRAFVVSGLQLPVSRYQNALFLKYDAEHVVIQLASDAPGYLVLTDAHYPGWAASLDSQPVAIETAYGLFRAVAIPAGVHRVEFVFNPVSVRLGAGLSLAALAGLVAVLGLARRSPGA